MPILPSAVLPKRFPLRPQKLPTLIQVSPQLIEAAECEPDEVLLKNNTVKTGLSEEEAERRLDEHGPNVVAREERHARIKLLGKAIVNPLVVLLVVLATISVLNGLFNPSEDDGGAGDLRAGLVIILMVILGVVLRFVQEARADSAAAKLRAMISVKATVLRDGKPKEEPIGQHRRPAAEFRLRLYFAEAVCRASDHRRRRGVAPARQTRRGRRGAAVHGRRLRPAHRRPAEQRHLSIHAALDDRPRFIWAPRL